MTIPDHSDRHNYALDKSGAIVHLVRGHRIAREDYFCIGCGKVVRVVMGNERVWHFRHLETNPDCDHESWLHKFAKRYYKEKFESKEPFVVSYWTKNVCSHYNNCGLRSNNCFSENLHELDLKQIYDVCKEEKSDGVNRYRADLMFCSSKDPLVKPLFLEISYKHDCRPDKIASGIQIVELKIESEEDLEKPIVEPKQLLLNYHNNNPYSFCVLPNVRFYNFERECKQNMSQRLRVFVVFKDERQKVGHGILGENHIIECDRFAFFYQPSLLYVLFVPFDYMKSHPHFDLWGYGLFKAAYHGIILKNCLICRNCYAGPGGCVRHGKFMADLLGDKEINKDDEASNCNNFSPFNANDIRKVLAKLGPIPLKEIVNK